MVLEKIEILVNTFQFELKGGGGVIRKKALDLKGDLEMYCFIYRGMRANFRLKEGEEKQVVEKG